MPLIRKTRLSGSSVVVTIPSQLLDAYDITIGDEIEIIPLNSEEIKIRKTNGEKNLGGAV